MVCNVNPQTKTSITVSKTAEGKTTKFGSTAFPLKQIIHKVAGCISLIISVACYCNVFLYN